MTDKKTWTMGDKCFVTTSVGIRRATLSQQTRSGGWGVRLANGVTVYVTASQLYESKLALRIACIREDLEAARYDARDAVRDSARAKGVETRALLKVAALEERLAAAKASVAK